MNISYKGYNTKFLTVYSQNATVGYPLYFNADGDIINAATGYDFIGVAVSNREGIVGMQEQGYIEMKYTGTAPKPGYCKLASGGSNNVKVGSDENVKIYKVLMVDTTNQTVGFML